MSHIATQPRTSRGTVLTFDREELLAIIRHTLEANDRSPTWDQQAPVPPSAWLVGDSGVYIMSNGRNAEGRHGTAAHPVAYARECNPSAPNADDVKRATFGGDDGSEFLPVALLQDLCDQSLATVGVIFSADELRFVLDPA